MVLLLISSLLNYHLIGLRVSSEMTAIVQRPISGFDASYGSGFNLTGQRVIDEAEKKVRQSSHTEGASSSEVAFDP